MIAAACRKNLAGRSAVELLNEPMSLKNGTSTSVPFFFVLYLTLRTYCHCERFLRPMDCIGAISLLNAQHFARVYASRAA
jgi:hypothetical protein